MSKLLEKLQKAAQMESQRLGFGAQARAVKRSTMVLLAELPSPDPEAAQRAVQSGADAIFVAAWRRPEELQPLKRLGETLWGTRLPEHYEGNDEPLLAAGCDFVAFTPETTRVAVLRWEKLGKAMELSPELPDSRLRAVEMLPIDVAVLDDRGEGPFTVGDLLDLARLMAFARKPTVLRARSDLATGDLAALRDNGIVGVMLPAGGAHWDDRLRQYREAIDTLPPRAKRLRAPLEAVLPQARAPEARPEPDEDRA